MHGWMCPLPTKQNPTDSDTWPLHGKDVCQSIIASSMDTRYKHMQLDLYTSTQLQLYTIHDL